MVWLVLMEVVLFGNKEALLTMVADWSKASAKPDRHPTPKTPNPQSLQSGKDPTRSNQHGWSILQSSDGVLSVGANRVSEGS